jgi:hypothetical protein
VGCFCPNVNFKFCTRKRYYQWRQPTHLQHENRCVVSPDPFQPYEKQAHGSSPGIEQKSQAIPSLILQSNYPPVHDLRLQWRIIAGRQLFRLVHCIGFKWLHWINNYMKLNVSTIFQYYADFILLCIRNTFISEESPLVPRWHPQHIVLHIFHIPSNFTVHNLCYQMYI